MALTNSIRKSNLVAGPVILLGFGLLLAACSSVPATTPAPATSTLSAAPTAAPAPTATPTPITTSEVTYNQISFAYHLSIANIIIAATVPGQNAAPDAPYWAVFPTHTEFSLTGYPSKNTYHQPKLYVYPVADYEQVNPSAKESIQGLENVLADQSASPANNIPFLPLFNAAQVFRAQVQYVTFQNGRGVRFVAQYDQAPLPINNLEVFYTFQGLTDDGQYYVAAVFPV